MKKLTFIFRAVLLALVSFVSLFSLVGCEPDSESEDPKEEVLYQFSYVLGNAGTNDLDFIDLSVTYLDADGKKQTEKVSALPWKKTFSGLKAGFRMELEKTIVLKKDIDLSKIEGETVKVSNLNLVCSVRGSDNSFQNIGSASAMTIRKEKAVDHMNNVIATNKPFVFVHQAE